jgi:hypothetical protein
VTAWVKKEEFDSLTAVQIHEQIAVRQAMMQQMVGTLYPSIVQDELNLLYKLRGRLPFEDQRLGRSP